MNPHQDIYYGETGQTLVWDAPEGRPSSVTGVSVYELTTGDDGTTESATTGSASVETNPDTTVDAASGAGQANARVVNVAATTGFARERRYLITSADGHREWFDVDDISSGASVTAFTPLTNAYASADTVESTRMSIAIDDTWVADTGNISDDRDPNAGYRIRWEYVVNSITYVHDSYFDLVRYRGDHTVTPEDMESFYPNWKDRVPTYHRSDNGKRLIDEAYKEVKWDVHQSGHADEMIRSAEGMDELTKNKARALIEMHALFAGKANADQVELALSMYNSRLDQLVRVVSNLPEATDSDGGGHTVQARSIWSK